MFIIERAYGFCPRHHGHFFAESKALEYIA
jgi:hypothetical protein